MHDGNNVQPLRPYETARCQLSSIGDVNNRYQPWGGNTLWKSAVVESYNILPAD